MTTIPFKTITVRVKRFFGRTDYEAADDTAMLFVEGDTHKRGSKAISAAKIRELQKQGWTINELN